MQGSLLVLLLGFRYGLVLAVTTVESFLNIPVKLGFEVESSYAFRNQSIDNMLDPAISCGVICKWSDCSIFVILDRSCSLYNRLIVRKSVDPFSNLKAYYKRDSGQHVTSVEAILFRQDVSRASLLWPKNVISLHKDDPKAELYAKLDDIEDYRSTDGQLHLKMCHPGTFPSCFRWSQTDNPLMVTGSSRPKGFVYKEGPLAIHPGFFGLSQSTPDKALLDGDLTNSYSWFLGIGTYEMSGIEQKIPASRDPEISAPVVELYVELF
ncbi:uncharacterized protein LOC131891380 [Tigriopus californicus]|uniref:uncharacterized protein LOC131891380 n=1 Tax=Tigriopus californicus TaxID=6832 RepID=UPI0027DA24DE|nr:uncharacterized protein LOC131891380 [Tigriopus californicus]